MRHPFSSQICRDPFGQRVDGECVDELVPFIPSGKGRSLMYIGIGAVVVILAIVLLLLLFRGRSTI
jgi:hypothetical protein